MSDESFDIVFTPDELREAILDFGNAVRGSDDPRVQDHAAALLAFSVDKLSETRPADTSEEQLLADEELVSTTALGALEHLRSTRGSRIGGIGDKLRPYTLRPLLIAKEATQQHLERNELRQDIEHRRENVRALEVPFYKNAKQMRELKYKVGDRTERGVFLEQRTKEIENLGFTDREARLLAGLALEPFDMHRFAQLKVALGESSKLWQDIAKLGGGMPRDCILSAVNKICELYEADERKLSAVELAPIRKFAERFSLSDIELAQLAYEEVDLGPFEHAPELPIIPFEGSRNDAEAKNTEAKSELSASDFNEEDILKDLHKSIEQSGLSVIVEPQRIKDFIETYNKLISQYGANNIRTWRTLRPEWHPLPWIVIEVSRPNRPTIAVLEIGVYGNASYVISNKDWYGTLRFRRKDARKLPGVHGENHIYDDQARIIGHPDKLYNQVRKVYDR